MKIELVSAKEFETLRGNVERSKIKKRDGFEYALIGDTVYIAPDFDFRSLLVDAITTAIALNLRGRSIFSKPSTITSDLVHFLKMTGCNKELTVAAADMLLYLVGKKMGHVAFGTKLAQEHINTLADYSLDKV